MYARHGTASGPGADARFTRGHRAEPIALERPLEPLALAPGRFR